MTGRTRWAAALAIAVSCVAAACGGSGEKRAARSEPVRSPVVGLGEMVTVAGGGQERGDGGPATAAGFCGTTDVAVDDAGNLYIADGGLYCDGPGGNSVRKVDTKGVVSTIAGGTGVVGFDGDGGPATEALLDVPLGVAADAQANVYISDADNFRIRKVDSAGTITTLAGTGEQGYSGEWRPRDVRAPDGSRRPGGRRARQRLRRRLRRRAEDRSLGAHHHGRRHRQMAPQAGPGAHHGRSS